MALSRIEGPDDLYVGGVFALRRRAALKELKITHILSMIAYSPEEVKHLKKEGYIHLEIDLDDDEDEDIIKEFPKVVRFIDSALHPEGSQTQVEDEMDEIANDVGGVRLDTEEAEAKTRTTGQPSRPTQNGNGSSQKPGAVFVHCVMGKSRSVTAIVAYLLWKYPTRFGLFPQDNNEPSPSAPTVNTEDDDNSTDTPSSRAKNAVFLALQCVRRTRAMAEPNSGFMKQLAMWVRMGMPAEDDGAVERNGMYQRWLWEREVADKAKYGQAPDWIIFEDETEDAKKSTKPAKKENDKMEKKTELRCKRCRKVLVTERHMVRHTPQDLQRGQHEAISEKEVAQREAGCQHYFIEPLSWMKPTLEEGELEGKLYCPNAPKCNAPVGRYSWQGYRCTCGEWVCPAFSLQKAKVDEFDVSPKQANGAGGGGIGIRLPPGRTNL